MACGHTTCGNGASRVGHGVYGPFRRLGKPHIAMAQIQVATVLQTQAELRKLIHIGQINLDLHHIVRTTEERVEDGRVEMATATTFEDLNALVAWIGLFVGSS